MRRNAVPGLAADVRRPAKRRVGLVVAPQVVEDDRAVDQRLHVARVQLQRAVDLRQRLLLLSHKGVRDPEQVVRVGERPARGDHFLQQVDGAVVVLELEPLARLIDEMFRTDIHAPPRTTGRNRPILAADAVHRVSNIDRVGLAGPRPDSSDDAAEILDRAAQAGFERDLGRPP